VLHIQGKFEHTNVIRSRKSKDRQYSSQKEKNKRKTNDLRNTTQKRCFKLVKMILSDYMLVSERVLHPTCVV
jgi:hypothetical protein